MDPAPAFVSLKLLKPAGWLLVSTLLQPTTRVQTPSESDCPSVNTNHSVGLAGVARIIQPQPTAISNAHARCGRSSRNVFIYDAAVRRYRSSQVCRGRCDLPGGSDGHDSSKRSMPNHVGLI